MTTAGATQIYQVFIKTTSEELWKAITTPEFTAQYFYRARITVTPDAYRSYGPDDSVWGDGSVAVWDPPHKLVHEWRSMYDPELAAEEPSRVTWEIGPQDDGTCLLTVTHDRLEGAPRTAQSVSGPGWTAVLSGLKTLLETGRPMIGGAA
jgi:uncharacterized protein YndB with AHSA1/START domain